MREEQGSTNIPDQQPRCKNSKQTCVSAASEAPTVDTSICIGAIRITYPGRFGEDEIPSDKARLLNVTCRALDGIEAIAQILYANDVERDAGGEKAECLRHKTVLGLHEALIILIEQGNVNATNLGDALFREAKGGAK